ncbi:MAG: NAD-dependent epimerase/dehydratase family protein, partial [Bdellovibrionales bacterium]
MKVLLTGGAGYIGSHTGVELIKAGHDVVLYDNLCNANPRVVSRIEKITGRRPAFVEGDV